MVASCGNVYLRTLLPVISDHLEPSSTNQDHTCEHNSLIGHTTQWSSHVSLSPKETATSDILHSHIGVGTHNLKSLSFLPQTCVTHGACTAHICIKQPACPPCTNSGFYPYNGIIVEWETKHGPISGKHSHPWFQPGTELEELASGQVRQEVARGLIGRGQRGRGRGRGSLGSPSGPHLSVSQITGSQAAMKHKLWQQGAEKTRRDQSASRKET